MNIPCQKGILLRNQDPLYIDVLTSSVTPLQYTLAVELAVPFKLRQVSLNLHVGGEGGGWRGGGWVLFARGMRSEVKIRIP